MVPFGLKLKLSCRCHTGR